MTRYAWCRSDASPLRRLRRGPGDQQLSGIELQQYERGIHAIRPGAGGAGVTEVRFRRPQGPAAAREPARISSS
jgi:hypothetical protein